MALLILRWLAFLASLSLILVYFKGGTLFVKDIKRSIKASGGYAYLVFAVVMGLAAMVILASQILICLGISKTVSCPGKFIAALGAVAAIAAILAAYRVKYHYLGRFWSGNVEIKKKHKIIDYGPYAWVRHPLYSLTLFIYPGTALAFSVWWVWAACAIMTLGYVLLTEYEDRYLAKKLPGYKQYQKRTQHKLIPGVW